ncbi:MAG: hypothetical protein A2600_02910 [Candidatus Lambdaproteobacteria bacterium RIFOXYD1_FULL_56_27]|uniref:NfeD-like C-terminal domain-containing protein n=1 Tax=Candidatus Lambdaproteobacteria bacterium RIFOXYD2_FULL_56_26 TaxID=1817773 RepID=A0A1F6H2V7_9PROT|nr:MAG: hypothetical protein A2557_06975 [Candidatus Lambdaproteobacteria bacterium RIFOXYD2_FULL_56_26]OGH05346.1 MAG: hypothetical protein A2426_05300 [Candidatus Lambdaproteobacteria bacterium RIFOXYC1_FULL_56_13]OGH09188.1 MAG: hypothetical protein A2600_02910 [Candidatus Lambdaproteobacteria bacterium RIFOXYD1_FULL_56_27]
MANIEFWSLWIFLGFFFLLGEIYSAGLVLASLAPACFVSAFIGGWGGPIWLQVASCLVLGVVSVTQTRAWLARRELSPGNTNAYRAFQRGPVGLSGIVEQLTQLEPTTGIIRLEEELWEAKTVPGTAMKVGQLVQVLSVEGKVLLVHPLSAV